MNRGLFGDAPGYRDAATNWGADTAVETTDAIDNDFNLRRRCFRAHGERNHFPANFLRLGKPGILQAQPFMLPHRLWPVHQSLDTVLGQMFSQTISCFRPNHVILKYVASSGFVEMRQTKF